MLPTLDRLSLFAFGRAAGIDDVPVTTERLEGCVTGGVMSGFEGLTMRVGLSPGNG